MVNGASWLIAHSHEPRATPRGHSHLESPVPVLLPRPPFRHQKWLCGCATGHDARAYLEAFPGGAGGGRGGGGGGGRGGGGRGRGGGGGPAGERQQQGGERRAWWSGPLSLSLWSTLCGGHSQWQLSLRPSPAPKTTRRRQKQNEKKERKKPTCGRRGSGSSREERGERGGPCLSLSLSLWGTLCGGHSQWQFSLRLSPAPKTTRRRPKQNEKKERKKPTGGRRESGSSREESLVVRASLSLSLCGALSAGGALSMATLSRALSGSLGQLTWQTGPSSCSRR
jgi:hypothetical protein